MKEKLSLLFKIIIVIETGLGLYLNFRLLSVRDSIIYFTIQSNLLCFVFYLITVILMITKKLKKNDLYYILKGITTFAITVTMLVYQLVLSSGTGVEAYVGHELECNFVHLFTPLLIVFDYIVFSEKGHTNKKYPFMCSLILIYYIIFVIIYVLLGGTFAGGVKYPYPFMNIEQNGVLGTYINCTIIYLIFIGIGYVVQLIDNKIAKKLKSK